MREYTDDSFAISKAGFTRWSCHDPKYDYESGELVTREGSVTMYMQGGDVRSRFTQINFSYGGRLHMRTYRKRYTRRGVVTKAKQFVADVCDEYERGEG